MQAAVRAAMLFHGRSTVATKDEPASAVMSADAALVRGQRGIASHGASSTSPAVG